MRQRQGQGRQKQDKIRERLPTNRFCSGSKESNEQHERNRVFCVFPRERRLRQPPENLRTDYVSGPTRYTKWSTPGDNEIDPEKKGAESMGGSGPAALLADDTEQGVHGEETRYPPKAQGVSSGN